MEKTCSCAVASFVMAGDDRVRCRACNRPITGRSAAGAAARAAAPGALAALNGLDA